MFKIGDYLSDIDLSQRKYDETSCDVSKAVYGIIDGTIFLEEKYYRIKENLLRAIEKGNAYALALYLENEKSFLINERYSAFVQHFEDNKKKMPEQWEALMALHSRDEVMPRDVRDVDGQPVMDIYNVQDLVEYRTHSYIMFDKYKEAYDKDAFGRLIFCDDEYKHLTSKECEEMAYKHVMNFFSATSALMKLPNCQAFVHATQKAMIGYYTRYRLYKDPTDLAKFFKLHTLANNKMFYTMTNQLGMKDIYISETKKDRMMIKHWKKLQKTKSVTGQEAYEIFVKRCACLISLNKQKKLKTGVENENIDPTKSPIVTPTIKERA